MHQHPQPGGVQGALHDVGEPGVLEDASGEGDGVQSVAPGQCDRGGGRAGADGRVDAGRHGSGRCPPPRLIHQDGDQRSGVDLQRLVVGVVDIHGPLRDGALVDGPGEGLQLDGGLALVADPAPEADDGGGGVEQATHARRRRAVPAGHQVDQRPGPVVEPGADAGGLVGAEGVVHPGHGHPPRFADRRAAAGHGDRAEVADALEPHQIGHQ
ncbi:hypothetical protein BH20ACT2_BH20ACT2_15930 [soil metagenome]